RDPRADIYEVMAKYWCDKTGNQKIMDIAKICCEVMWRERKLAPNVDFYSAPFAYAIGLPILLFTPLFAASRSAGWVAHTLEQLENNVLIRPLMKYQGDIDRKYRALDDR
nr:citrate/2-methylcitrate synthase [Candidatus Sigynarchaeota archaeon]